MRTSDCRLTILTCSVSRGSSLTPKITLVSSASTMRASVCAQMSKTPRPRLSTGQVDAFPPHTPLIEGESRDLTCLVLMYGEE